MSGAIHGPLGGEASRPRVQPVAVGHPGVHGQPVAHVVAALDDPGEVEPGAPVIRGDEALHPAIPPASRPLAVERPHTTVERILQKYRLVGPANGPPGEDGAPAGGHRHDAFVVLGQLDRDLMAKIATVALPAGSHPHRLLEVGQHLAVVGRSIAAHGLGLAEIGAKPDGEHRVGAPVPVHAVLGLEHDAVGAGAADDDLRASGAGDDLRRHPHLDRLGAGGELSGSGREGTAGESGHGQHPDSGEARCTHPQDPLRVPAGIDGDCWVGIALREARHRSASHAPGRHGWQLVSGQPCTAEGQTFSAGGRCGGAT